MFYAWASVLTFQFRCLCCLGVNSESQPLSRFSSLNMPKVVIPPLDVAQHPKAHHRSFAVKFLRSVNLTRFSWVPTSLFSFLSTFYFSEFASALYSLRVTVWMSWQFYYYSPCVTCSNPKKRVRLLCARWKTEESCPHCKGCEMWRKFIYNVATHSYNTIT